MANILRDRYLWTDLDNSRSFSEYRILKTMSKLNLPVPRPIAARVRKQGLFYQADLMTSQILNARSMADLLVTGCLNLKHWIDIGNCIRRFHRLGFYHNDLNIENIMIDHEGTVFLLDFDKGSKRQNSKSCLSRLFKRICRSVKKWCLLYNKPFPIAEWNHLIVEPSLKNKQ